MPFWETILDGFGIALALIVACGVLLVVRRRQIARHGGVLELSYRARTDRPGRGWLLGMGRYTEDSLQFFRIFSFGIRPKATWARQDIVYLSQRTPEGPESMSLYGDHVVVECATPNGPIELAMSPSSLMGFQSWLEARPPGTSSL